jgi:hypothetical protein
MRRVFFSPPSAEQDRQLSDRLRRKRCVLQPVVVAVERRPLAAAEGGDDPKRLLQLVEPVGERAILDAVGPMLVLLPPGAKPQHHAAI